MTLLIAPTERPPFASMGQSSSLPERLGVDCVWDTPHGLCGCQRKEQMDLVASVRDGRLGRELEMMRQLHTAFLCIEGQPSWDREGNLQTQHTRWTLKQQRGVVMSIQQKGVYVVTSRNALETVEVVEHLVEWTSRADHVSSLIARPAAAKNGWGKMDDRATFIYTFSAVPMISSEMAARVFDTLGNVFQLRVGAEELRTVDGLGPKRIASILKTFGVAE